MIKEKKDFYPKGEVGSDEIKAAYAKLNAYRNALLSDRVDWVNKRMKELIPKWQRWLMNFTKSKTVADFFNWEIHCFNYPEAGKHVIELQHKGKVIDSKTFKA